MLKAIKKGGAESERFPGECVKLVQNLQEKVVECTIGGDVWQLLKAMQEAFEVAAIKDID